MPISRAFLQKYPRGLTPTLRRKIVTWPNSGVEFENYKAKRSPHGWPKAHSLNSSSTQSKQGWYHKQGTREVCPEPRMRSARAKLGAS